MKQGYLLSTLLFNIVLEFLVRVIRQEHEIKGIQMGQEIKGIKIGKEKLKPSLFANDMILYITDPKTPPRKQPEIISSFGKVAGNKINT
jgi:hypothetical protein